MFSVIPESIPQPLWEWLARAASWMLSRILSPPRPVDHNLPGEAPRPIGRDHELRWLRTQLAPSSSSTVCALIGPGGVGKTHLALAVAHEYLRRAGSRLERLRDRLRRPSHGFFDAIVFVSAQEIRLDPAGMRSGRALTRLPEITAEIARTLGAQDLLTQDAEERATALRGIMGRRRVLLILDGLENMAPEVLDFLHRIPVPSRALITSRRRPNDWPALEVRLLDLRSSHELIRREAGARGISLQSEEVKALAEAARGLPLAIILSVARLQRGASPEQLLRELQEGQGDLAEFVVDRSIEALRREDENACRLFRALALFEFNAGAHRDALGEASGLDPFRRDQGLMRLMEWSLCRHDRKEDRFYFTHSLIHTRAMRVLEEDPEAPQFRERWLSWYRARLAERPQNIPLLRAERANLVQVLEFLRQKKRMEKLARCLWEAKVLLDEGPLEPYLEALRALLRWALDHRQGDLLQGLIWQTISRAGPWKREFWEKWWDPIQPLLRDSEKAMVQAERERGRFSREQAQQAMETALNILTPPQSDVEVDMAIDACNFLGFLLMSHRLGQPDYQTARKWLEHGLALLERYSDQLRDPQEWGAILRGNLAILLARSEGRYAEAIQILEEIRPHLRWKRDLAEWHLVMAVYGLRQCRIREAHRYGLAGEELLRELGWERIDTEEGEEWMSIRARLERPFGRLREQIRCWLGRKARV